MNKLKYCPICGKIMYSEIYYNHITGNSYLKYSGAWCELEKLMSESRKRFYRGKNNEGKY